MTDLSKLSDVELRTLYEKAAPPKPVSAMSDDELKAAYSKPTATDDAYKAFDSGLASGIATLGGAPGDLSDLGARGISAATNWVERKLGLPESAPYDPQKSVLRHLPTKQSMQSAIQRDFYEGEKPYEPQTKAGQIAHATGEIAPTMAAGPGGIIAKLLGTAGAGAGQVYGGDVAESLVGSGARPYGEFMGTVAGGLTPNTAARLITPNPVSPARQRLLDILNDEGVTSITAGQKTGNKRLQYLEDAAGNAPMAGGRPDAIRREGQEQFTEAVNRRAGIAGRDASPEILAANQQRLGDSFRDLAARNDMVPDNRFITDIVDAVRNYRRVPDSQQRAMVQGYVDDIIDHVNAGAMPGSQYQEMRSRLSRQANSLRQSDPTLSEALRDMRNALDNAMDRSITPVDREMWRRTRREYGAQKDIEKAVSRAGVDTAEGQIVPANIRNVVSANNRGAYARNEGDLSELSRAASGVMTPLPNSGTAQRSNAFDIINGMTLGIIPAATGRAIMNPISQAYLGNQLLARQIENLPPATQAVLRALSVQDKARLLSGPSD